MFDFGVVLYTQQHNKSVNQPLNVSIATHRRVGGRVGSAGLCTPFFSASLVKLMEGPPVYAKQAGGAWGVPRSTVTVRQTATSWVGTVGTWPGDKRGTGDKINHSAGLLVLPPTLYMYLPWTWPPFPYLRTQKATTPFACSTYLDYYFLGYLTYPT